MFLLWRYFPIFLLLRNASLAPPPQTNGDDNNINNNFNVDQSSGTFEKTRYIFKAIDGGGQIVASDTSINSSPTVASAFWNPGAGFKYESRIVAEFTFDDESDQSAWSRETDETITTTDESVRASARAVNNTSSMAAAATITTRAFWHSKKEKEARKMRKNIERDFLAQYDLASLQTDLTKLDEDKLKLVCQISSPKETYYTSRKPKFKMKSLRFLTSRKRRMTANLLYCPNMSAYVRESATNPSQCVYIFKRRFFFRTKLWLQDQKCVNLKTETTAPPTEE